MSHSMDEYSALKRYDDFLDEVYEDIDICGLSYSPSRTFKLVDEIAYRTSFNDWLDSENIEIE